MNTMTKSYTELMRIPTFAERYEYLKLKGAVGKDTFGYDRYLNQVLYRSEEWKRFRRDIILRDNGCDLGMEGYEVPSRLTVHHLNPINVDDVVDRNPKVFDPENVICVSHNTHMAIHYGDGDLLPKPPVVRTKNDTCPWRQ